MKKVIMSVCAAMMCCTMMYAADAVKYVKVTDVTKLETGDKVIMGYNESAVNSEKCSTGKFLDAISEGVTASGDTLSVTNTIGEITLGTVATGTTEDGETIITTTLTVNGVLLKVVKDGTNFSTKATATQDFTIAIDKSGNAIITNLGSKKPYFRYNSSNPRFALYTSTTMAMIQLYKKTSGDPSVHVESVALTPSTANMVTGDELTLTATVLPNNAGNKDLTWSSDKESVAKVSSKGVVTAVAAGVATITATSVDGGKTATCVVTVKSETEATKMYSITDKAKQLVDGAYVAFCYMEDVSVVMGTYVDGNNNIKQMSATDNEDGTLDVTVKGLYTVHVSGDTYAFEGSDGNYIYAASTVSNQLKAQGEPYYWTVNIEEDGSFTVQSTTNSAHGMLLYNPGSKLFSCYANLSTSVKAVVLYSSVPAGQGTGEIDVVKGKSEEVRTYKVMRNGRIEIESRGGRYSILGAKLK